MEAVTAGADARRRGTGSKTIADLLPLAAEKYADAPALRHKVGDDWRDFSYADLGEVVKEVALGLIDLGIEPGDKISILAHTRPEWTYASFGILASGAALGLDLPDQLAGGVPLRPEPLRVDGRLREDAEQLAKIRAVEGDLPELEHVIVLEPGTPTWATRSRSTTCASAAAGATRRSSTAAHRRRHPGRHLPLHLHVRHDRPAQGLPALARQLPRDHRRVARQARSRAATASTCSSRWRTRSRC